MFLLTPLCFSFIVILASTRWWSEAASAPLWTLTSGIDLLNFCPMQIWSIWFSVLWSCDTQVALWILRFGKTLPPMIMLINAHTLANISPFSFIVPSPCLPMTSSYPPLSDPILMCMSPMSKVMSFSFRFSHNVWCKSLLLFFKLYRLHSTEWCLASSVRSLFWMRHRRSCCFFANDWIIRLLWQHEWPAFCMMCVFFFMPRVQNPPCVT